MGHSLVSLNTCPIFFPWCHSTSSNKIHWSFHHRFKCLWTYEFLHGLKLWVATLRITKKSMLFGARNTLSSLSEFFFATHFSTRIGNQAWWYIFFIVAHNDNTSFQLYPSHKICMDYVYFVSYFMLFDYNVLGAL
mgnify:CR=1 FL=1